MVTLIAMCYLSKIGNKELADDLILGLFIEFFLTALLIEEFLCNKGLS